MNPTESTVLLPVTNPADVAGVVPHLFGFYPWASLVVICLHGRSRRSGLILRFDLPRSELNERCADEVVARVSHQHADDVVLLCFSEQPDADGVLPHDDLVATLLRRFAAAWPVDVLDVLLVRGGRWWSYLCPHEGAPSAGEPLPEPGTGVTGQVEAEMAFAGRMLLDSRDELARGVCGPTGAVLDDALDAFERSGDRLRAEVLDGGVAAARASTVALAETLHNQVAAGETFDNDQAARVSLGMRDTVARDQIAWLAMASDGVWRAFLVELARRTPDGSAAPVCAVLALVAYQGGDGALANVAIERALANDPEYRMALMLRDCLDRQVPPRIIRPVARARRVGNDSGTPVPDVGSST